MEVSIYQQIVELKQLENNTERGYRFEALIREIQPWDLRPPIVMSPKSEQLDGVYQYKGITFIIESKAVKKTITPGMKEWEDYELKLRRRHGNGVIGLFCSLFSVSDDVYQASTDLNKQGYHNFILADDTWESLNNQNLDFRHVIDYMLPSIRLKYLPKIDSIDNLKKYCFDKTLINKSITNLCKKQSSLFLKRYKHKFHEKLYVRREIDRQIESILLHLRPNVLKKNKTKELPKQIILIRDYSGSGKTTLAIQSVMQDYNFFGFGSSAKDVEIDELLDSFIDRLNQNQSALQELITVNKPLLYFVDSLDETVQEQIRNKRKEVISTLKKLDELNSAASIQKLASYPLVLVFTIREEYWRDWDDLFEGRRDVIIIQKRITSYSNEELNVALQNYSAVYNYSIVNEINPSSKAILSSPINLEIFSEGVEYEGDIFVDEVWEGKIISNYFKRKEENIFKHPIIGFSPSIFNLILSNLAFNLIKTGSVSFSRGEFKVIINSVSPFLDGYFELILQKLISEQILVSDVENVNFIRFRYSKFVEYLTAFYIISKVEEQGNTSSLGSFTQRVFDSNIVSMYSVLSLMKYIARTRYPQLEDTLNKYYANSNLYLSRRLPLLRSEISLGESTSNDDLKMLLENTYSKNPKITWDAFFIVSAKNNKQYKLNILETFEIAWETNEGNELRWKLIDKLKSHNLLLEERILFRVLNSLEPKEWEVYLGFIIQNKLDNEFLTLCEQAGLLKVFERISNLEDSDWSQVKKLVRVLFNHDKFISGDFECIFDENKDVVEDNVDELQMLESQFSLYQLQELNRLLENLHNIIKSNSNAVYPLSHQIAMLSHPELAYINLKLWSNLQDEVPLGTPLFNFLVSNSIRFINILLLLNESPKIAIDVNSIGDDKKTAFQEIIQSNLRNKVKFMQLIYSRGYARNAYDDSFIEKNTKEITDFSKGDLTDFLLCKASYYLNDLGKIRKLYVIEKIVLTLLSFKYNRVIGFGFNALIQVVNNALQHYTEYGDLILDSLVHYKRVNELSQKPSFNKKLEEYQRSNYRQNHEHDDVFRIIFPELFK
ncbi:hypothetical protein I2I11_20970 [Pontibacter sp. 172403-2]|uniref:DUF7829 domain-containing protein n=1 Tax=Pontibacter rufus TaxID=2791028 RepID=UPI0018AFD5E3|nr:hypothetical protein [Pontibacter sp. 172403-2]MBF9255784.1 hypothetical protein [Pontibacter sp. 172403-2]